MTDRSDIDIEEIRERLDALRREIKAAQAAGDASSSSVELDQQRVGRLSRMDAMQVQAMAEETRRRRERDLARIRATFQRLDEGEYGYCLTCGDEIARKRLEIDPTTPVCIDCATNR